MDTKQVIVMQRGLKIRRGKEISQGSHASMAFLTKGLKVLSEYTGIGSGKDFYVEENYYLDKTLTSDKEQADEIKHWLDNSFKKFVVYVNSEEELDELHQKALDSGMLSNIIVDNGATEFHGIPTKTALAIGPASSHKFEGLTDHLPLL